MGEGVRAVALAACLLAAGCGPSSACVDGTLYTDFDQDGVFVREEHDRSGDNPVRCIEGADNAEG